LVLFDDRAGLGGGFDVVSFFEDSSTGVDAFRFSVKSLSDPLFDPFAGTEA